MNTETRTRFTGSGRRPYPYTRYRRWILAPILLGLLLLVSVYGPIGRNVPTRALPAYGGVFREGVLGTPLYINPVLCDFNEIDQSLCRLLFRGLLRFDHTGFPELDLAETYTVSADGLVYTFTLQPDIRWHDNNRTRVTASDVVFTYEVLQNEAFPGNPALAAAARLATVQAVEPHPWTVEFTLSQPFAPFLDLMTIGLLPEHIYRETPVDQLIESIDRLPIVSNGPMQVARYDDMSLRLIPSRNADYDLPYISVLEYRFHPNVTELFTAFAQGRLEGLSTGIVQNLDVLPNRSEVQLFASTESSVVMVLLNLDSDAVPFLQELQVRKALLQALNREKVVNSSQLGWGIVAHSPVTPHNWAHKDDIPHYAFDPVQAVRLLADSGWQDRNGDNVLERDGTPLALTLLTSQDATLSVYADTIAEFWRDIGIDVTVESLPLGMLVNERLSSRTFDAALVRFSGLEGDPDPFRFWHSSQAVAGQLNYGAWDNPFADELMARARIVLDVEERRWLYHQFQDVFVADLPALPISYPVYVYGVHERVKNVQIGPLNHAAERFASFADWYIQITNVALPEDIGLRPN